MFFWFVILLVFVCLACFWGAWAITNRWKRRSVKRPPNSPDRTSHLCKSEEYDRQ